MILYSFVFFFFSLLTMKYKNKSRKRIILESILIFLFGLISVLYFIANYFTKDGINFTVIDTLKLGMSNAGFGEYILLIVVSVFSFFFLFILAFFYYRRLTSVKEISSKKIKGFLHNGFLFLAFITNPFLSNIYNLYMNLNITQSADFEQFYKTPEVKDVNLNNKNLVYIYLESFERTYFDDNLFPNLTSNLKNLINKNGIEFTNISHTVGDDYTLAGMVSTQCGMPLFAPYHGNGMSGVDKFYPNVQCIGDILKNQGYYLSFMLGSNVSFAGKDKFYKTHSFDEILDKNNFIPKLKDKNYLNGWGLYDDDTLDFFYEKFLNLSEKKEKFALFTLTLDTHHPKGHLSKSCNDDLYQDGKNSILNTFHCSDRLVSDLIKKIQTSEYGKNTIIVIGSDHLSLANTASDILEKAKERRNLFVVFDPDNLEYKKIDDKATSFDVAPTVLSFLGINTDLGLGKNILISQSLISSFDKYVIKLLSWRETILKFWNFPKLEGTLVFDDKKENILFPNNKFKLPILIKIEEENNKFYFQEGVPEKLFEQFSWLDFEDKYIYIDNCSILTKLLDSEEINGKLCLAQGKYGKKYKIVNIDKVNEYRIDDFSDFNNNESKFEHIFKNIYNFYKNKKKLIELKKLGTKYKSTLEEGITFNKKGYPDFLSDVEGVSIVEEWGRWSDAKLNPNVKFTFKDKLPKNFTLSIDASTFISNLNKKVKIKIGNEIKEFELLNVEPRNYTLDFRNVDSNVIEIIPPNPVQPEGDERELSLGLVSLKVFERGKVNSNIGILYKSTLEEGITFNKKGYPEFLTNVEGISSLEEWGRWSDAKLNPNVKFTFKDKLPKDFVLSIKTGAIKLNVNKKVKVKIGNEIEEFELINKDSMDYNITFRNVDSNVIEIIPASPKSPKSLGEGDDERELSLGLVSLKILKKEKLNSNMGILYKSTLEEGITFNKKGYPDFLSDVEGVSIVEEWGRWSDAKLNPNVKFTFRDKLPKNFTLSIDASTFISNLNKKVKIKIGNEIKEFELLNVEPRNYTLDFRNVDSNVIEIISPNPVSPKSLNQGDDERKLSLGFVSLKILKKEELNNL